MHPSLMCCGQALLHYSSPPPGLLQPVSLHCMYPLGWPLASSFPHLLHGVPGSLMAGRCWLERVSKCSGRTMAHHPGPPRYPILQGETWGSSLGSSYPLTSGLR